MRRAHRRTLLLLVLLGAVAIVWSAGTPASAIGCGDSETSALAGDGDTWVTFWAWGCRDGALVVHTPAWDRRAEFNLNGKLPPEAGYEEAIDVEAADGGGWWVLTDRGGVFRYTADWTYANESDRLPTGDAWEVQAFSRDERGRWWYVTRDPDLVRVFDPGRNESVAVPVRAGTDVYATGSRLLVLEDLGKGGAVFSYRIPTDWTPDDAGEIPDPDRVRIGPEIYSPSSLARGPDGSWWLLDSDGNAFEYTSGWVYTGTKHGSDVSTRLWTGLLMLSPWIVFSMLLGMALDSRRPPLAKLYFLAFVPSVVFAILLRESLLPPPASLVYWLPGPAMLALAAGLIAVEARRFPGLRDVGPILGEPVDDRVATVALWTVANLALVVVALDFALAL